MQRLKPKASMQGSIYWRQAAASSSEDGGRSRSWKSKPERRHADTTELDIDIWASGQFADVLLPAGESLLPPAGIGADTKHAADMVEDDRRAGKGVGEVDRVPQLRMVLPGFEAEAEWSELGETLAKFGGAQLMRRDRAGGE